MLLLSELPLEAEMILPAFPVLFPVALNTSVGQMFSHLDGSRSSETGQLAKVKWWGTTR